jgi:hypothetical protein
MASAFGSFDPNRLDTSDLSTKVKADGFLTKTNGFDKVDNSWDALGKWASDTYDGVADFVSPVISDIGSIGRNIYNTNIQVANDGIDYVVDKLDTPEGISNQEFINTVEDRKNQILMYPETLGIGGDSINYSYNSNTNYEGWGLNSESEPYIHFGFKRITVTDKDIENSDTATGELAVATASMVGARYIHELKKGSGSGGGGGKGFIGAVITTAKVVGTVTEIGLMATAGKNLYDGIKKMTANAKLDQNPNRETYAHVGLYMPPTITIQDGANYEASSRAALAAAASLTGADRKDGETDKTNNSADTTVAMNAMLGMGLTGGGLVAGAAGGLGMKNMSGLAGAGQIINLVGKESNRILGRALNPNEYMQFKSSQLRTFTLNFKFLPVSENESKNTDFIIRQFRSAMYPIRNSGITLTVPDIVDIKFKNVGGMVSMPEVYITNINVTYNPNSASFFKQGGRPVEIDMAVELQEIHPIHRKDVILKGY